MKDLMWEMFSSTGHVCAYLLYKEYERTDFGPDVEKESLDPYPQNLPLA